jgi:uncharacterized protein (UPF0212 family)
MKTYSVLISASAIVVVKDAPDEEEAMSRALDEVRLGDLEMDDTEIEEELETPAEIETACRHCAKVIEA